MRKALTIIVSVLIGTGIIGLCVGLGIHFGRTDEPKVTVNKDGFYLLDAKHEWRWSDNNKFIEDKADDLPENVITQYVYTAFFEKDEEVKVWKGSDDWSYNNLEQAFDFVEQGENLKLTKTGTYRFYLKLYTDGGNSLYIEKKDETDANNLYTDMLRFEPLRPYDETKMTEYDKFRICIYTMPNYNGGSFYTPLFIDNPLKTKQTVILSGEIGYKKTSDGDVQYLPYTMTVKANKANDGIDIAINGSDLIHMDNLGYSYATLGLIYKY